MAEKIKIVFIADIIGEHAVEFVTDKIPQIKRDYKPDFIIANIENAQNGKGINVPLAMNLKRAGIQGMTSGNHIWDIRNRDVLKDANLSSIMIRPGNYPEDLPGKGFTVLRTEKHQIVIVNIQGLTFMENIKCPFEYLENRLIEIRSKSKVVIVDFHAEATSEKRAFASYFDGKVSAVIGTHTHVQTADEQLLPEGTAFITDAGMTGPADSVIGMDKQNAIDRFIKHIPNHYKLAKGDIMLNGVYLEINKENGKCEKIARINGV